MKLTGAESEVTVGTSLTAFIPRSNPVELYGVNTICLRNPKMCDGSFSLGIKLDLSDLSADGIIVSTTGHNTSIVGTSLFLKGSNLFASVRTVSRIWEVSAPASSLTNVDEVVCVDLFLNYDGEMRLHFNGLSHRARYTVAAHMPLADDQVKNVIKFGGVDLRTNWIDLEIFPYSNSLYRKYQHAGISIRLK